MNDIRVLQACAWGPPAQVGWHLKGWVGPLWASVQIEQIHTQPMMPGLEKRIYKSRSRRRAHSRCQLQASVLPCPRTVAI